MEREDKNEDIHSKALNTVPNSLGNSEESTRLTEQSVWYGSVSSPTPKKIH